MILRPPKKCLAWPWASNDVWPSVWYLPSCGWCTGADRRPRAIRRTGTPTTRGCTAAGRTCSRSWCTGREYENVLRISQKSSVLRTEDANSGSEFFPSWIQGQKIQILLPIKLSQLSDTLSRMFINFYPPGSRGQKGKNNFFNTYK